MLLLVGVRALILVGLERVANMEQLAQLEFGRGFAYNRPLGVNLLDLDYELVEQLVRFDVCTHKPAQMPQFWASQYNGVSYRQAMGEGPLVGNVTHLMHLGPALLP